MRRGEIGTVKMIAAIIFLGICVAIMVGSRARDHATTHKPSDTNAASPSTTDPNTIDLPPGEKLVSGDVSEYNNASYLTQIAPGTYKLRRRSSSGKILAEYTVREHPAYEKAEKK